MSARIHSSAFIDAKAELGADVEIGPGCVVGPHVRIGDRSRLVAHVYIETHTGIGADCTIHPFAALGGPPQDLSYKNEPTRLEIGDNNVIREHATIHRGTVRGRRRGVRIAHHGARPNDRAAPAAGQRKCAAAVPMIA